MRITGKQLVSQRIQYLYFLLQFCCLFFSRSQLLFEIFFVAFQLILLISKSGQLLIKAIFLSGVSLYGLNGGYVTLSSSATLAISQTSIALRFPSSLFFRKAIISRRRVSSFFFSSSAILATIRFILSASALLLVSLYSLLLYMNSSRKFLSGRLTGYICSLLRSCSRSSSSQLQRLSFSLTSYSSLRMMQAISFSPAPSLLQNCLRSRLTQLVFSFCSRSISILQLLHWISKLRYLSFSSLMVSQSLLCSSKDCLSSLYLPASSPSNCRTFSVKSFALWTCFSLSRRALLSCSCNSSWVFCMALIAFSCCCCPPLFSAWVFSSWIVFLSRNSLLSSSSIFRMLLPITIYSCFFSKCSDYISRVDTLADTRADCASLSRRWLLCLERTELEMEDSDIFGLSCWSYPLLIPPPMSSTGKFLRISYS